MGILHRNTLKSNDNCLPHGHVILSPTLQPVTSSHHILSDFQDDITAEIYSDYLAIWPSALPK